MIPVTIPRATAEPRPVWVPASDNASEKPMLIPAPTAVARPTNRAACEPESSAAAKIGARVESVPSIRPTSPGWTYCRMNVCSSIVRNGLNVCSCILTFTIATVLGLGLPYERHPIDPDTRGVRRPAAQPGSAGHPPALRDPARTARARPPRHGGGDRSCRAGADAGHVDPDRVRHARAPGRARSGAAHRHGPRGRPL